MASRIITLGFVSLGICAVCDPAARASLGGGAASIDADASAMQGTRITRLAPTYSVAEIAGESSMQIREFSNDRGVVFAVSWSGPVFPDLRLLLGCYFGRYTDALATLDHAGVHRSVRMASPQIVVESSGHLRAYRGLAYLPAELPAGVSPGELQ